MSAILSQRRKSIRLKHCIFYGVLLGVAFAGMEGALRISMALIPGNPLVETSLAIPDSRLGQRLNPSYPGHDQNGFRNVGALRKADLVVLGDSQTYGYGIPLDGLWPQLVGELVGMRAYNMGVPGYGPVQSLLLLENALDLGPAVVVEAFYSGNDLYDSFRTAYYLNDLGDLKSVEKRKLADIIEWETRQSLSALIAEVYNYRAQTGDSGTLARTKRWLNAHVMIYRLLRTVRDRVVSRPEKSKTWDDIRADAERYPEDLLIGGSGVPATIFTPRYRLAAIDLKDPRIEEGLNVSLRAMERMSRRVAEKGGCFAVVMIPTKEFVYGFLGDIPASRAPSRTKFLRLLEQEREMWYRTRGYLTQRGIPHVDVGPALSRQVRYGEAVYPTCEDGHPTVAGHRAIAQHVTHSGVCGLGVRPRRSEAAAPDTGPK